MDNLTVYEQEILARSNETEGTLRTLLFTISTLRTDIAKYDSELSGLRAEEENDDAMKEHLRKKNKKLTKERDLLLREVEALREVLGRLGQKRNDLAASAKHEADALAKQRSKK